VHGKLEWEALGRTGRMEKKVRHSLKREGERIRRGVGSSLAGV
jgi:hypothetical protein